MRCSSWWQRAKKAETLGDEKGDEESLFFCVENIGKHLYSAE